MTNPLSIHQLKQSSKPVTQALQDVLSSTYGLFLSTHNYHWNVEGGNFIPLHKLFEDQYNELFEAIDEIAERIRALGGYVLLLEADDMVDDPKMALDVLDPEMGADERASLMVHNLIMLHKAVVEKCETAKEASCEENDDETENLMVTRVTVHQKSLWMLNSIAM